ncbi:unnamed protein product [Lactuca virosa]|uniref:Uncharacterized protein n=1 Tax=Lactuca virosa TaxID=75947 RepID=A0AAU9MMN2_9ASTR|nr:unnamed protein product [Lactuca virosa]
MRIDREGVPVPHQLNVCSTQNTALVFGYSSIATDVPNSEDINDRRHVDQFREKRRVLESRWELERREVAEVGDTAKDYHDPPPVSFIEPKELTKWSLYRAVITEFIATLLFLYVTILTVISYTGQIEKGADPCGGGGILGIASAFSSMIFVLRN